MCLALHKTIVKICLETYRALFDIPKFYREMLQDIILVITKVMVWSFIVVLQMKIKGIKTDKELLW